MQILVAWPLLFKTVLNPWRYKENEDYFDNLLYKKGYYISVLQELTGDLWNPLQIYVSPWGMRQDVKPNEGLLIPCQFL